MYAPKKREKDVDDSESEDEVATVVAVKPVEVDKTPVVQIDEDEIKRLTKYFEDSRIEMDKKVDTVLLEAAEVSQNIDPSKNILANTPSSKPEPIIDYGPGKSITLELAKELRNLTVRSSIQRLSDDWRKAKFVFHEDTHELSYGLIAEKNGSKGLILAVQTYVIKHLVIHSNKGISGEEITDRTMTIYRRILSPNTGEKRDALVKALSEILWNAGEKQFATVVTKANRNVFQIPQKSKVYYQDGLTETLKIFEFDDYKRLEGFVAKNLTQFQNDDGLVLFLYSLILSRKTQILKQDLQESMLIGDMEDCRVALYNLVIVGVATPFLHNKTLNYDRDGNDLDKPEVGIHKRSDIGLLYYDSDESDECRTEVGSMLKTPKFPIWLVVMNNLVALIFNTNIDLLNDWRLEQCFSLYFYSGLHKQENSQKITIDTREPIDLNASFSMSKKYSSLLKNKDKEPDIVEAIFTKWPNCEIRDVEPLDLMALL